MSKHVNLENDKATITFESALFEEVFIETEWTIVAGGKGDARTASVIAATSTEPGEYTQEQMQEFIQKASDLEQQKETLEFDLDVQTNIKSNLDKRIKED
jgi:hypothetical protein